MRKPLCPSRAHVDALSLWERILAGVRGGSACRTSLHAYPCPLCHSSVAFPRWGTMTGVSGQLLWEGVSRQAGEQAGQNRQNQHCVEVIAQTVTIHVASYGINGCRRR